MPKTTLEPERADPQPRRTALERMQLARRIDEARAAGTTWKEIARAEDIPQRTAQDILRKFKAQVQALEDPNEVLIEMVFYSTAAVDVFAHEMEYGDSSSARVGAANGMLRAQRDRANLLAAAGVIPGNVGAKTQYRDMSRYLERVERILAFDSHRIPDGVLVQIAALRQELEAGGEIEEVTPAHALNKPKERPY